MHFMAVTSTPGHCTVRRFRTLVERNIDSQIKSPSVTLRASQNRLEKGNGRLILRHHFVAVDGAHGTEVLGFQVFPQEADFAGAEENVDAPIVIAT